LPRVIDWLPLPIIFGSYQFAGWVGRRLARPSVDRALLEWDQRLFGTNPGVWLVDFLPRVVLGLFEVFYFSYYILVLTAPLVLYLRQGRGALWHFWTTAAVGFWFCDLLFPWFPSTPPRLLDSIFLYGGPAQAVNWWVLNHFSIHGNVFPSSHVAAAVSFDLCHFRYNRRQGWLFGIWAAGLTVSTVSGGYHYGVDAAGGVAVGIAADLLGARIYQRLR